MTWLRRVWCAVVGCDRQLHSIELVGITRLRYYACARCGKELQ